MVNQLAGHDDMRNAGRARTDTLRNAGRSCPLIAERAKRGGTLTVSALWPLRLHMVGTFLMDRLAAHHRRFRQPPICRSLRTGIWYSGHDGLE